MVLIYFWTMSNLQLFKSPSDLLYCIPSRFLCAQCKQMECSDCALLYCNNHHIRPIDEVARRDRDFIEAKLQDLQVNIYVCVI